MAGHVRRVDSGRWQGRFPVGGGRYRSRNFDRKGDAQRWVGEQSLARDRGRWVDPRGGRVRFDVVAGEWMEGRRHLALSTRSRDQSYMRSLILPRWGDVQIGSIERTAVEGWVGGMRRAAGTVHKAHQILSGVLARGVETGRIGVNPARGVSLPSVTTAPMRVMEVDEVRELALRVGDYGRLVWCAALTGMRWSELAGLRWDRVDVERRFIRVVETLVEVSGHLVTKEPKTSGGRRQIAIGDRVVEFLGAEGDGYVFVAPEGGPLRRSNFRRQVWARASGGVRFHDLRHTHASWLIREGVHPKVISERLGHASIGITMDTYGHLMDGMDGEAARLLDEALQRHSGV